MFAIDVVVLKYKSEPLQFFFTFKQIVYLVLIIIMLIYIQKLTLNCNCTSIFDCLNNKKF